MPRPAYRRSWLKVRAYVLRRDRYACQIGIAGVCVGVATEVDHLDPVAFYGPCYDPARLRAACGPCNRHLGGQVAVARARIAAAAGAVGPSRTW